MKYVWVTLVLAVLLTWRHDPVHAESVQPDQLAGHPWRIVATTLPIGESTKRNKSTKKPSTDDLGTLFIDNDRYLILDGDGKVFDHGHYKPLGDRGVRLHNCDGTLELKITELTPQRMTLDGSLRFKIGGNPNIHIALAPATKAPPVPRADTLARAADLGDVDAIRKLVGAGAKVDELKGGISPLMRAVMACHPSAVRQLLDLGASTEIAAPNGSTAIILASECNDVDTVQPLLAHHAKVRVRRHDEYTPLLIAAGNKSLDIVRALVEAGADLNDKDRYDFSLLASAVSATMGEPEAPELVEYLLKKKADPNSRFSGAPVLMVAAMNGHVKVVRLLLQYGADPKATDLGGRTVMDYAKDPKILELIKSKR